MKSLEKSGERPSDLQAAGRADADGDSQWLHAAWQQLQALAQDEEHSKLHPEPWVSAALMECSLQQGKPLFASHAQRSQFVSGMQSVFKTCYQRMVWPKLPHTQASRQRWGSSTAPLTDSRGASQLLITIGAAVSCSNLSQPR